MKINREQIEALAALPDEKLWSEIVKIASAHGFTLPVACPPHSELEKLRGAVLGNKINVGDALKILNNYRKGK